jgi:NADH dehydrogenase FAD-containing subunit
VDGVVEGRPVGKNLVLVGGGHAHLTTIARIHSFMDRGHRVTLIGPSPYHYYSGMGPGMLGGFYRPEEIRFPIQKMVEDQGAVFVKDRVSLVRPEIRELSCASGRTLSYDVVSFNVGSHVPMRIVSQPLRNVLPAKPIENLYEGHRKILDLLAKKVPRIVTIGGGPAGVEISGNIARLVKGRGRAEIQLLAEGRLLPRLPERARSIAFGSLISRGVEIVEGARARHVGTDRIHLQDGRRLPYDLCFIAVGVRPPDLFTESGLRTGQDGALAVNPFLQSIQYPEIFGGGDCIRFLPRTLGKVGVYAVRQNPVLHHNLLAVLEEEALKPFRPGRDYFLILNLGDGRGLFWWRSWAWDGKPAFFIKNRIDRRFMKKFLPV